MVGCVAHAAGTFEAAGITYAELKWFAQQNGLTLTVSSAGFVLKGNGKTVTLYPFSKAAKLNGAGWTMAAPALLDRNVPSAPLADLQRAFGIKATGAPAAAAAAAPIPAAATPAPTSRAATPANPTYRVNLLPELRSKIRYEQPFEIVYKSTTPTMDFTWGGRDSLQFPAQPQEVGASCANRVFSRLKSPATADFGPIQVVVFPNNAWVTYVTVDAQNSYGALIRTTYYCENQVVGGVMMLAWDELN